MGADVNRHSHRRYNRTHARVACSATYDGTRPIDTVYYGYSKESLEWLPGLVLLGRRVLGYTVFNIRFTLAGRKRYGVAAGVINAIMVGRQYHYTCCLH